tara:strand:+ start:119 stop:1282 length:1164 start_codon:yes stop_codon:yes gene_type:complete
MNILVVGAGYVGLSNAVLLAVKHNVKVVDIDVSKIKKLRDKISPIKDKLLDKYLKNKKLKIDFTTEIDKNLKKIDIVLIATPTNFDSSKNSFDTSSVKNILNYLEKKKFKNLAVIRSTIPIGFTEKMQKNFRFEIAFFPEFLREGQALRDSLYPSRIICGSESNSAKKFLEILKDCSKKKKIDALVMRASEAESIKLFSNSYLAMRIAFFNEVDSFASSKNLDTKNIIKGISLDPRIGDQYNNPSFGYGGYCLPKDNRQLISNFGKIPQKLISAINSSNKLRKKFILDEIVNKKVPNIGVYKLSMKMDSDNIRESALLDILKGLKQNIQEIKIFEPLLDQDSYMGIKIEKDLKKFLQFSNIVITNRIDKVLTESKKIIYTKDIFNKN